MEKSVTPREPSTSKPASANSVLIDNEKGCTVCRLPDFSWPLDLETAGAGAGSRGNRATDPGRFQVHARQIAPCGGVRFPHGSRRFPSCPTALFLGRGCHTRSAWRRNRDWTNICPKPERLRAGCDNRLGRNRDWFGSAMGVQLLWLGRFEDDQIPWIGLSFHHVERLNDEHLDFLTDHSRHQRGPQTRAVGEGSKRFDEHQS